MTAFFEFRFGEAAKRQVDRLLSGTQRIPCTAELLFRAYRGRIWFMARMGALGLMGVYLILMLAISTPTLLSQGGDYIEVLRERIQHNAERLASVEEKVRAIERHQDVIGESHLEDRLARMEEKVSQLITLTYGLCSLGLGVIVKEFILLLKERGRIKGQEG